MKLKRCPCGQIPDVLEITDIGQDGTWAAVVPGCCGEWTIVFRSQYLDFKSKECMDLAIEAWNEAPRGGLTDQGV